jgi:hypothetical protein
MRRTQRTTERLSSAMDERRYIYESISAILGVYARWVYTDKRFENIEALREYHRQMLVNNGASVYVEVR